jgi:hypothetical protein
MEHKTKSAARAASEGSERAQNAENNRRYKLNMFGQVFDRLLLLSLSRTGTGSAHPNDARPLLHPSSAFSIGHSPRRHVRSSSWVPPALSSSWVSG